MFRKTLSIYWRAMRPRKWLWLIAYLGATMVFISSMVIQPLILSKFIGALTNLDGKTISDFMVYIWLWLLTFIIMLVSGRINLYVWFRAQAYSLMDLDLDSFATTMGHSSDFFANNFTGSLVTKFNRFNRSLVTISGAVMFELNALLVQIIFPFIIILYISPKIALVFLAWAILYALSLIYLHKRKFPLAKEVAEYDSKVTGVVADVYTNALTVKMFASFPSEIINLRKVSLARAKSRIRNLVANDHIRVYKFIASTLVELIVIYMSAKFALAGTLTLPEILLIQLYLRQLISELWEFGKLVEKLEEAFADAEEMTEIYDLKPTVRDSKDPIGITSKIVGNIEVKDIDFRYDGSNERDVFTKLNLHIPVGQKVGLVGPSGGGKTTFTKLLLRFMDTNSGQILIDNYDISKITQDDLRRNIAYVPQEPLLFHRSIYDNIAYGNPEASKEEVLHAAKLAHADEFIDKLPNGYETLVGERGVKLSGGQKQRVAIARAMLKKAPILLLDEATSALDSKSEKLITSALNSLMKDRTTIVIAHRLSTIRKLDRIILLKDGKAIEDGTHTELLKQKGLYAELWGHQHGGFIDD